MVEQVGFKEDLAVGDRDHVRRDVGRHVVGLRFDDRQGGHRTGTSGITHFRSALEETRVKVEHVARIGFTTWWTTKQKRHLAIRNSLLGKVIINDEGVHAVVAEPLTHGAAGEGCKVLERSRLGSRSGDNDRIVEGAALFERLHNLGNRRTLLADSNVDTEQLVLVGLGSVVCRFLVQDRVDADSGLAGLTVTDDQLALTTADRDHGIDSLDTCHHWLVNAFTRDDARCFHVNAVTRSDVFQWAFAVDWLAQRIDNAAEKAFADWRGDDLA